jgi:hypothetical protein
MKVLSIRDRRMQDHADAVTVLAVNKALDLDSCGRTSR